jgi:hypothetical protein
MNEIEKDIETISGMEQFECCCPDCDRRRPALLHAIQALREKQEREKGCKICTAGDGEFTVKCLKWNDYKFCPMCGRKLEVDK